jgi:hypothetical protein
LISMNVSSLGNAGYVCLGSNVEEQKFILTNAMPKVQLREEYRPGEFSLQRDTCRRLYWRTQRIGDGQFPPAVCV